MHSECGGSAERYLRQMRDVPRATRGPGSFGCRISDATRGPRDDHDGRAALARQTGPYRRRFICAAERMSCDADGIGRDPHAQDSPADRGWQPNGLPSRASKATATPGDYTFEITPKKPGPYLAWADLRPAPLGLKEYEKSGIAGTRKARASDRQRTVLRWSADGLRFALSLSQPKIKVGVPVRATLLRVTKPDGSGFADLPLMSCRQTAHTKSLTQFGTIGQSAPSNRSGSGADAHPGGLLPLFQTELVVNSRKEEFMKSPIPSSKCVGRNALVTLGTLFGLTIRRRCHSQCSGAIAGDQW